MDENQTPQTYSEEEIKQVAELLSSGVVPVAQYELDEVVSLIEIAAKTISDVYSNKTLGKEDFLALQDLWNQAWVVKEKYEAIQEEAKNLGLIGKITLVIRGFVALNKLFKAIKQARS